MAKTLVRVLINTAIGVVLIYFWLKLVNLEEIFLVLKSFNLFLLIPSAFFMVLASVLKALRLKILLSKEVNIPSLKMINITFLSQLLSFTIPVRAGEVAKGVYLSTEYNLHFGKAIIWVFLDRFLDFWAILVLSLALLLVVPTNLPQNLSYTLFAGVLAASVMVVLVVEKSSYFRHLAKLFSHLLVIKLLKEKFLSFSLFLIECFSLLHGSFKRNISILILTVMAAFSEGLVWYFIFSSFIPGVALFKVLLGSMLTSLTFLIPAAPGYVGSAEAAGLAVFSYGLGFSGVFASATTIIMHGISLVFILSSGIFSLYFLKFNLKLVWKKILNRG